MYKELVSFVPGRYFVRIHTLMAKRCRRNRRELQSQVETFGSGLWAMGCKPDVAGSPPELIEYEDQRGEGERIVTKTYTIPEPKKKRSWGNATAFE